MLKQKVEDKSQKVSDTFTDSDGRVYRRSDYEDEGQPGFTRPGTLFSSFELQCCGKWNLTAPSGHLFSAHLPLEPRPDPTRVSRADAPAPLLEAAAAAWARLNEVSARSAAALEKRTQAEAMLHDATRRADKKSYNQALAAGMKAEAEFREIEAEYPPLRVAVSKAEEAIRFWCDDERLRRLGLVEEAASATF